MDLIINNNKFLIGLSMILVNFGSRFIIQDLTLLHNKILSHQVTKIFIMTAIFFTATRDIIKSCILTFIMYTIIYYLLDENKEITLWHSSLLDNKVCKKLLYSQKIHDLVK